MKKDNSLRDYVVKFIEKQFGSVPEQLWARYPGYQVFRHTENKKWYAVIMNIAGEKLGLLEKGMIDILDVKADPVMAGSFLMKEGFLPGYHMNKQSWVTILLDGTVSKEEIELFLETSFELTNAKKKGKQNKVRNTKWLIPANPKYYDIEKALSETSDGAFTWKQSNNICVGDTVYLYVAAPVSAIRYKCKAVEVDIPYEYADENIHINRAMRLKLLERYDKKPIGIEMLKEHGVFAVRGPRSIPNSLVEEIKVMYQEGGEGL